jgi:hypothetical protein
LRLDWQWCIAESFHDGRTVLVPIAGISGSVRTGSFTFLQKPEKAASGFLTGALF